MLLNGVFRDVESFGDLLSGGTSHDEVHHLSFALSQAVGGCPHPSHQARKQALAEQVVKSFRSREIENGWVDHHHYTEKMLEIEEFLREQVSKAYEAGAKDKEGELT